MESLFHLMLANETPLPWQGVAVSELLSFLGLVVVAEVYVRTHDGLSYSRSFVQSLVLGGLVATALMLAVGNNLARGIGILGTLAIIRFRSTIKDPRDMIFVFQSLGLGIAMGVRAFSVGILSTVVFCGATWLLHVTEFGTRNRSDGLLRFLAPHDADTENSFRLLMARYCQSWVLVLVREVEQGAAVEHSYQVKLLDPGARVPLLKELESIPGVRGLSLYLQEATAEL